MQDRIFRPWVCGGTRKQSNRELLTEFGMCPPRKIFANEPLRKSTDFIVAEFRGAGQAFAAFRSAPSSGSVPAASVVRAFPARDRAGHDVEGRMRIGVFDGAPLLRHLGAPRCELGRQVRPLQAHLAVGHVDRGDGRAGLVDAGAVEVVAPGVRLVGEGGEIGTDRGERLGRRAEPSAEDAACTPWSGRRAPPARAASRASRR